MDMGILKPGQGLDPPRPLDLRLLGRVSFVHATSASRSIRRSTDVVHDSGEQTEDNPDSVGVRPALRTGVPTGAERDS